ncbi:hypothetical protein SSOG_08852 [Streptomyces himastatinicus ATCC 53653]|uniref:Uncharacterized protein n=1 Tax=Streptomyces himastatinicus ATCC 53653 TaxID=457427 RepID=D9WJ41_9ACTN|nr:hypothetical protein [Streptomyces himastatinicus]EFL29138.1 hypothetical protein SSOG_08852 [Streptomyces himastatinicus ATCC 53653]
MLPTEPPLSLHRLVAPVPPARPQETATATRQTPAPAPAAPQSPNALERLLAAGQNQVGNAAVAGAAAQTSTVPAPPVVVAVMAPKPKAAQPS